MSEQVEAVEEQLEDQVGVETPGDDLEQAEVEVTEGEQPEEAEANDEPEEGPTVVTFGDEEEPEPTEKAPSWARELRKRNRELNKENAALKASKEKTDELPALGAEPTLESCDWDADKYKVALREYDTQKAKIDTAKAKAKEEQDRQAQLYNSKLETYQKARLEFDADEFDEAESNVKEALSDVQQSIIVQGLGSRGAALIRGIGTNEKRLKEISQITDPIEFTVAITRLDAQMNVSKRKPKTAPESRPAGSAALPGSTDKTLEKLEAEADRTGDRSKILAYKRSLRRA